MDQFAPHDLRCDELRQLSDGWDGRHSKSPTEPALRAASKVIDEVTITPLASGGVFVGLAGFDVILVHPDGTVEDTY